MNHIPSAKESHVACDHLIGWCRDRPFTSLQRILDGADRDNQKFSVDKVLKSVIYVDNCVSKFLA